MPTQYCAESRDKTCLIKNILLPKTDQPSRLNRFGMLEPTCTQTHTHFKPYEKLKRNVFM